jgi:small-conductance mechanosensitive channel
MRLLRAAVANSSKLDRAFQQIVNVFFYFLVALSVLAGIGIAPNTILSPVGAFIVGLGFMVRCWCILRFASRLSLANLHLCATDRISELQILGRHSVHPFTKAVRHRVSQGSAYTLRTCRQTFLNTAFSYLRSDRINISDPLQDTSVTGSVGWIVKDLNLYSTTVIYGSTNEEATYSNGSLAASRTINMARSFKAQISCTIKFPIDAPYEKLMVFKNALEKFVLSRPREFASFVAFRATRVEADLGFVEYIVYTLHRESWQEAVSVAQSKADLNSFALELSKKMNLRYRCPPMPVDLTMHHTQGSMEPDEQLGINSFNLRDRSASIDMNSISALFEQAQPRGKAD